MRDALSEGSLYRLMVESLEDFAVFFIAPDGSIRTWNPGAVEVFGFKPNQIIGQPASVLFTPEDIELGEPEKELGEAARTGWARDERWHQRQDGSRVWVRGSVTGVHCESGELLGFVKVAADRTDWKDREEQLQAAKEQVSTYAKELENRVAVRTGELELALGEMEAFCYSISHNLRAPLRAMEGFSHILLNEYANLLGEEGQGFADRIGVAARKMDRLIQDLLNYSYLSREQITLSAVDLEKAVRDAVTRHERLIRRKEAAIELAGSFPAVIGHDPTLFQAIANIVHNALKFVGEDIRPQVRIRAEHHASIVRLWIEDNGIGIEPEFFQLIFRPFERLHPAEGYGGTGIGLALARKAVEKMGGRIGVESVLGQGSRFWVELPAAEGLAAPDKP